MHAEHEPQITGKGPLSLYLTKSHHEDLIAASKSNDNRQGFSKLKRYN
jgi:hypothetical protein